MPTALLAVAAVVVRALGDVLILGGATAGVYASVAYALARRRVRGLDQRWARRMYRRASAILLGVGTLMILVTIPRFFTIHGLTAGVLPLIVAGVAMIAAGRIFMVRLRESGG